MLCATAGGVLYGALGDPAPAVNGDTPFFGFRRGWRTGSAPSVAAAVIGEAVVVPVAVAKLPPLPAWSVGAVADAAAAPVADARGLDASRCV